MRQWGRWDRQLRWLRWLRPGRECPEGRWDRSLRPGPECPGVRWDLWGPARADRAGRAADKGADREKADKAAGDREADSNRIGRADTPH